MNLEFTPTQNTTTHSVYYHSKLYTTLTLTHTFAYNRLYLPFQRSLWCYILKSISLRPGGMPPLTGFYFYFLITWPQQKLRPTSLLPNQQTLKHRLLFLSECKASYANEIVMSMCHGRRECHILASPEVFGNPCSPSSNMYMKTVYTCGGFIFLFCV